MRRSDLDRLVKEAGLATAGIGKALAAAGLLGAGAYGLSKLKKKRHAPMMGAEGGESGETPAAPTGNAAALEEAMKYGTGRGLGKVAEELSAAARKHIKEKNFALPGKRYPIEDKAHARNALARAAQHASPDEKAKIESKVHKKYPGIGKEGSALSPFRAAFVDEIMRTGVLKVAHEHPEPFIDQSAKGVTQEDQQEFGHGKGVAKKKPKPSKESSFEEDVSAAARKLASIFGASPMPAPAAAGAVLKLAESDDSTGVDGDANYTAGGPMYGHGGGVKDKAKGGGYAPGKGLPPKTPPNAKRKPKSPHGKAEPFLND